MGAKDLRVKAEDLKTFMKAVFEKAGFTPEGAENQADVLVWANLRGVDSHGVQRISWYLELVDKGHMKPRPNIQIQKETPATLLIDADYRAGTGGDRPGDAEGDREGAEGRHRLGRDPEHAASRGDGLLLADGGERGHGGHRHRVQSPQHGPAMAPGRPASTTARSPSAFPASATSP